MIKSIIKRKKKKKKPETYAKVSGFMTPKSYLAPLDQNFELGV